MSAIGKRLAALEQRENAANRVIFAWRNPDETSEQAIEQCMTRRGLTSRAGITFYVIQWGFSLSPDSLHMRGAA